MKSHRALALIMVLCMSVNFVGCSMEEAKEKARNMNFPKEKMEIEEPIPTFIECRETGETGWW